MKLLNLMEAVFQKTDGTWGASISLNLKKGNI